MDTSDPAGEAPRRQRVLIIEDDADIASVLQINLSIAGYDLTLARDGAAGLTAATSEPPDLILLDVMMPVLDGWQVLRALKEDDRTHGIPVVMLMALAEERDLIKGHLQGAIRYITKPFELRDLIETVRAALAPPDAAELTLRRDRVRELLQRLAELDTGRTGGPHVRITGLEAAPRRESVQQAQRVRLDSLTEKQRWIAAQFASGRPARSIAEEMGVSRSNIYATRKRIARKLGITPESVGDEAKRLGL